MPDEYNDIIITNDVHENSYAIKNDEPILAVQSVSEVPDSEINTAGKLAKPTSNFITLASVIVVAAAVVITASAAAVEPSAPLASVSALNVTSFAYNSDIAIEFVLEDNNDEIESYTAWIEDSTGVITECTFENDGEKITATASLSDGSDWESGLQFIVEATTFEGWTGEIYNDYLTLPAAPISEITELNVTSFAYNSDIVIEFVLEDNNDEIESYTAWIEDSTGVINECTLEKAEDKITAAASLSDGSDWESGLQFIVEATTFEGWTGEIYNDYLTLPAAPQVDILYVGMESGYYAAGGEGDVYIYVNSEYTGNVTAYICWFEDEEGQTYECTVLEESYISDGYGDLSVYVLLPTDEQPAFDIYGRLNLVVAVQTAEGWIGEVYREKQTVSPEYLSKPQINWVSSSAAIDGDMIYWDIQVEIYDPDGIWTQLILTLTDVNGKTMTIDLSDDYVDYVTDEYGTTTYYINFSTSITDQLELTESGLIQMQITATWHEPDFDGTYTDYDSIVYDEYV